MLFGERYTIGELLLLAFKLILLEEYTTELLHKVRDGAAYSKISLTQRRMWIYWVFNSLVAFLQLCTQ
jgi:hypothetical protein